LYGLTPERFDQLHDRVLASNPGFQGVRSTRTDSRVRVAAALRFLNGGSALDVSRIHGMRTVSFYAQFRETIGAIGFALPAIEERLQAVLEARSTNGKLQHNGHATFA